MERHPVLLPASTPTRQKMAAATLLGRLVPRSASTGGDRTRGRSGVVGVARQHSLIPGVGRLLRRRPGRLRRAWAVVAAVALVLSGGRRGLRPGTSPLPAPSRFSMPSRWPQCSPSGGPEVAVGESGREPTDGQVESTSSPASIGRGTLGAYRESRACATMAMRAETPREVLMRARLVSFGVLQVEGKEYDHDVLIDRGQVRKRRKGASKQFRDQYGHTPLSVEEDLPWGGHSLIIGTGASGALPVMPEVMREASGAASRSPRSRRGRRAGCWPTSTLPRSGRCCTRRADLSVTPVEHLTWPTMDTPGPTVAGKQGPGGDQSTHPGRLAFAGGMVPVQQAGRVDNVWCGHRDDSIRECCERFTRRITR